MSQSTDGTAATRGRGGTFNVNVVDNSTDGSSDTFSISLSNGYLASGTLTGGDIVIE